MTDLNEVHLSFEMLSKYGRSATAYMEAPVGDYEPGKHATDVGFG